MQFGSVTFIVLLLFVLSNSRTAWTVSQSRCKAIMVVSLWADMLSWLQLAGNSVNNEIS